jgi:hypothetical protein
VKNKIGKNILPTALLLRSLPRISLHPPIYTMSEKKDLVAALAWAVKKFHEIYDNTSTY